MKRILLMVLGLVLLSVGVSFFMGDESPNETTGESKIVDDMSSINALSKQVFDGCKRLADKGDAEAQYRLACFYEMGFSCAKSMSNALSWLEKAAEQRHPEACNELGLKHEFGFVGCIDLPKAFQLYQTGAEAGCVAAASNAGRCLYEGKGCTADKEKAVCWLKIASEKGNPSAKHLLGRCYEDGEGGVRRDRDVAIKLYQEASDGGNIAARKRLEELQR